MTEGANTETGEIVPLQDGQIIVRPPPFTTSPETDKLDAALAKAQGAVKHALKDSRNEHFKSNYADLSSVWEACREALSANGISVTQWPCHAEDSRLHLVTRLACAGQWMQAHMSMPLSKPDAHGYGSAVTYARRFALASAVGIAADDDDGNDAAAKPQAQRAAPPKYEKIKRAVDTASPKPQSGQSAFAQGDDPPF